ncbi:SAV_915 family protein [Streptomyces mobaraensis]|uniref:SAV_915 family protein n=1 Tax=Streptomyces mobaraensis TaxID=35621 RepID=UPI00269B9515
MRVNRTPAEAAAVAAVVAAVTAAHSPVADGGESSDDPSHPGGAPLPASTTPAPSPAPTPAGHTSTSVLPAPPPAVPVLYVPVRPCPVGFALRVFRTPLGGRTAVAFTTRARLTACLGPHQPTVRLALPAVRSLAAPLGVTLVSVDPQLTAPAVIRSPDGPSPTALLPTLPG